MAEVTVLGAEVAGSRAAWALSRAGPLVRAVNRCGPSGPHGGSWWAGGMLAPDCEGAEARPPVIRHGQDAAAACARVTKVRQRGPRVVAPARVRGNLQRPARRTEDHRALTADLAELDATVAAVRSALRSTDHAQIDPRRAFADPAAVLSAPDMGPRTSGMLCEAPIGPLNTALIPRGPARRHRGPDPAQPLALRDRSPVPHRLKGPP